jgi:Ni/Co efflux regulator RcnB
MKGFRKLSSIVILLFAFAYPPSLAEAKDTSVSNVLNEQSNVAETNLVGGNTEEILIAQRRNGRRVYRGSRYKRRVYRRSRYRRSQYRRPVYRRPQYRRSQYRRPVYIRQN